MSNNKVLVWLLVTLCTLKSITSQTYFYNWVEWDELNQSQRKAATCLGYNEPKWNCYLFQNIHNNFWWAELNIEAKKCAVTLGYDEKTWNNVSFFLQFI